MSSIGNDMPEQMAARDWFRRALVRITETHESGNAVFARRQFEAGETLDMWQWGREGQPISRDWWTAVDAVGGFTVPPGKVEVLDELGEGW